MKRCWQLESLHLEGNTRVLLPDLHILHSLTLINQNARLDDLDGAFLQNITMDRYTSNKYEQLKAFPKLEHLKILQSVNWQQKEEIDKLKLKSTSVHCFEVPHEKNLILRLNDDCFLHLQKYLSIEDWISLHETHPRFQHMVIPYLEIDKNDFPITENQKCKLPLVISLSIDNYANADLGKLMEGCSSLVDLNISLNERQDPTDYITHIPTGLKKLNINIDVLSQILDEKYVIAMFRQLNPTLISLHISDDDALDENVNYLTRCSGMLELHHIQELTCSTLNLTKEFVQFLVQNKDNMRKLVLFFKMEPLLEKEMWRVIGTMKSLQSLIITPKVHPPVMTDGCLPFLEHLNVAMYDFYGLENLLISMDGRKLRSFTYGGLTQDYGLVNWERMVNIEYLKLIIYGGQKGCNLLPKLFALTKLKKLIVFPMDDDQILPLIKGLPNLEYLQTSGEVLKEETLNKTREYLRIAQRNIEIVLTH